MAKENYQQLAMEQERRIAELETETKRAKELENYVEGIYQEKLATLPERFRSLIPAEYGLLDRLNYLEAHAPKFTRKPVPNLNAGRRGAASPDGRRGLNYEEQATAEAFGMSAEEYAKHKD